MIRCSLYIDDMILMAESKNALTNSLRIAQGLLTYLGFSINKQKSVFEPTQIIKHLPFNIDSRNMTLSITSEKRDTIEEKCGAGIAKADRIRIREVASIVGSPVACSHGTKSGNLFFRDAEREKIRALPYMMEYNPRAV